MTAPAAPIGPTLRTADGFRWDGVPVRAYQTEGSHFAGITRQTLLRDAPGIGCEMRYFEVAPGGHSSLERHEHAHAVMVLRGTGRVLLGTAVHAIAAHDVVYVPPMTWHQFRSEEDAEPLGFLCLVDCTRDRPPRPTEADLAALRRDPTVAGFIRV
jgi:quercetin dioxygenase-like cupin family protein